MPVCENFARSAFKCILSPTTLVPGATDDASENALASAFPLNVP